MIKIINIILVFLAINLSSCNSVQDYRNLMLLKDKSKEHQMESLKYFEQKHNKKFLKYLIEYYYKTEDIEMKRYSFDIITLLGIMDLSEEVSGGRLYKNSATADSSVYPVLLDALGSDDLLLKVTSLTYIDDVWRKEYINQLHQLINDTSYTIRSMVCGLMGDFGTSDDTTLLKEVILKDSVLYVIECANKSLVKLGGKSIVDISRKGGHVILKIKR